MKSVNGIGSGRNNKNAKIIVITALILRICLFVTSLPLGFDINEIPEEERLQNRGNLI